MIDLYRCIKCCSCRVGIILFVFVPLKHSYAFNLLSEGALDSVSAVSAESAEALLNVAGSPAAGITIDGYESLPFRDGDVDGQDQGSAPLDSALADQVEAWADERRNSSGSGFEVGFVDELPAAVIEQTVQEESAAIQTAINADDSEGETDEPDFEVNRVDRLFEARSNELGPTRFVLDRDFDRRASINVDPNDFDRNAGDAYVFNVDSANSNRRTAVRDEFKPLF